MKTTAPDKKSTTLNLKLDHIKQHPELHKHNFEDLVSCCTIEGKVILQLLNAHSLYIDHGSNGGIKCDVFSGPCACGAWH